jgi:hypothetical protein
MRKALFARSAAVVLALLSGSAARAQVENVPASNQVYEFIDRLGVRGILPAASTTMVPMSRGSVAGLLLEAAARRGDMSSAEAAYLDKFMREFAHDLAAAGDTTGFAAGAGGGLAGEGPDGREPAGLFNCSPAGDFLSDKEKYLYYYTDSSVSLYLEFLGSLEYRRGDGDTYDGAEASMETHGFRARGTIKNRLGYYAQVSNGTLWGDHEFALDDPRLRSNFKFNENNSPYFDFAEAYLRADLSWFNLEFGREFLKLGTGYSDRLILTDNAPALDMLKLDAHFGAVRYQFIHGSVLMEPAWTGGLPEDDPLRYVNKYVAFHRLEVSAFGVMNAAFSEGVVYDRTAPEWAYLNPLIFLKSAEHSLQDRDNTMLALDLELFPFGGYKLFGGLFVDDVDFSKLGTDWWGNQFGWQGGAYAADVAGIRDVDLHVEYTRIDPFVYTNRLTGNAYTNGEFGLGHRIGPNSDEWLVRVIARPAASLRGSVGFRNGRHGANVVEDGVLVFNAGGDILAGHREEDGDTADFLGGVLATTRSLELRAWYEPVTNLTFAGEYAYRSKASNGATAADNYFSVRGILEF